MRNSIFAPLLATSQDKEVLKQNKNKPFCGIIALISCNKAEYKRFEIFFFSAKAENLNFKQY